MSSKQRGGAFGIARARSRLKPRTIEAALPIGYAVAAQMTAERMLSLGAARALLGQRASLAEPAVEVGAAQGARRQLRIRPRVKNVRRSQTRTKAMKKGEGEQATTTKGPRRTTREAEKRGLEADDLA